MLIRFFKENDLIDCGGDPQPIRLQVCAHGCACRDVRAGVRMICEHEPACVILTLFNIHIFHCSKLLLEQECIPVGCVPPAAVAIRAAPGTPPPGTRHPSPPRSRAPQSRHPPPGAAPLDQTSPVNRILDTRL